MRMRSQTLSVQRLQAFTDFASQDWDRVAAAGQTRSVFLTFAWQRAWWESFGRGDLILLRISQGDEICAIASLFAECGMVYFVGSGGSDYLDFLGDVQDSDVMRVILSAARDSVPDFLGFRFYHVRETSRAGALLSQAAASLGLSCFDEGDLPAPVLEFANWPAGQRSPAEKKSLLRHERKLERQGCIEVQHFTRSADVLPHLPEFFAQHISRWAATEFPSLFLDPKQCDFYKRLVIAADESVWLRFTRVAVDGHAVAYHLGSHYAGEYLWYKPAFDIGWSEFSPGEVLLRHLLLAAEREGARAFDFGLGDEAFKHRFATRTARVRTWGLYPKS